MSETYELKVKSWKKIYHVCRNQKQAAITILISQKADFKQKSFIRNIEGHYILIKRIILREDTILIFMQ
jgi:hypothetical protein